MAIVGPSELVIVLLQIAFLALPLLAWVYMYRQGAAARDLIFWGVLCVVIPILGPIAAMLAIRRSGKQKRRVEDDDL